MLKEKLLTLLRKRLLTLLRQTVFTLTRNRVLILKRHEVLNYTGLSNYYVDMLFLGRKVKLRILKKF